MCNGTYTQFAQWWDLVGLWPGTAWDATWNNNYRWYQYQFDYYFYNQDWHCLYYEFWDDYDDPYEYSWCYFHDKHYPDSATFRSYRTGNIVEIKWQFPDAYHTEYILKDYFIKTCIEHTTVKEFKKQMGYMNFHDLRSRKRQKDKEATQVQPEPGLKL